MQISNENESDSERSSATSASHGRERCFFCNAPTKQCMPCSCRPGRICVCPEHESEPCPFCHLTGNEVVSISDLTSVIVSSSEANEKCDWDGMSHVSVESNVSSWIS